MNLSEQIASYRVQSRDRVIPYFADDDVVAGFLNEAQREACIRARLIHAADDAPVCNVPVSIGQAVVKLHATLYELTHCAFKPATWVDRCPVHLVSTEWLDANVRNWRDAPPGTPAYAVQDDKTLRLVPRPDIAGTIILEGYRLPKFEMEDKEDEPEIGGAHHPYLVQWAIHKVFSIPDARFFDAERAGLAEAEFTRYFGPRPDADLRRTTREDVPHHVVTFWP